jgi:multisubunit Na+/H+ antiporter MnhB subunit
MFSFKNLFKKLRGKKAMELEVLGWVILGIFFLAILIIAYVYLNNHNTSLGEFVKNLFRLRK